MSYVILHGLLTPEEHGGVIVAPQLPMHVVNKSAVYTCAVEYMVSFDHV